MSREPGAGGANVQLTHAEQSRRALTFPITLIAHDVDAPVNVGSLFRLADALGSEKIYLTGSTQVPPNDKLRKASRASEQAVAYEYRPHALEVVQQLRAAGYGIVSLEITSGSSDIRSFDASRWERLALIVGAENRGVSQVLLDASDATVHIPMFGQNSSMNLATACGIALFELTRRFMPG
ncbi:MAG: TrmH family RNA methyltransferase [Polyangiales bacterium]